MRGWHLHHAEILRDTRAAIEGEARTATTLMTAHAAGEGKSHEKGAIRRRTVEIEIEKEMGATIERDLVTDHQESDLPGNDLPEIDRLETGLRGTGLRGTGLQGTNTQGRMIDIF